MRLGLLAAAVERLPDGGAARDALLAHDAVLALGTETERAVLAPRRPGALPHALRAALALRVARLEGNALLESTLARRLTEIGANDAVGPVADPAFTAAHATTPARTANGAASPTSVDGLPLAPVLAFVDTVTSRPRAVTAAHVERLRAAGVGDADIVRLAALAAFLAYQSRLSHGLELMGGRVEVGRAAGAAAGGSVADAPGGETGGSADRGGRGGTSGGAGGVGEESGGTTGGAAAADEVIRAFTMTVPRWRPRVRPIDLRTASDEQRDALAVTPSSRGVSDYVLVLAHDPETLKPRSPLFNAIMYGRGGLGRAERELAATAVSLVNRCVYCAAVHASRHAQITRSDAVAVTLLAAANGDATGGDVARNDKASGVGRDDSLDERERAIVAFARALSRSPPRSTDDDVAALRALDLDEREILDLILASALFGWANRLMHVLGDPVRSSAEEGNG